jgi:4-amino-4-deoxy-L-arabinose transferase-like glycosyltransferase
MVVGGALRFVELGGVPPALNQDEAVYGYDAYSLWQTGRDHLGHPFPFTSLETFGDWSSPLFTYLSIPAVALFGLRTEVLRAVAATIGVLGIPVLYLLALELFRRPLVGVTAAWLLAISPWHVHLSRWAIIPTVVPTLVAATMLLLVWSIRRRSNRGIVAAALVAGLTVASYHAMKVYIPLLGFATVLVYGRRVFKMKREALVYAVGLFMLIAGPILYLTLRDPGGGARVAQTSVFREQGADLVVLARQYLAYFSPHFLFVSGDGDPMHTPAGYGVELWSMLPLLAAGLSWLIAAAVRPSMVRHRQAAGLLLLALVLYPVPGSITVPSPHTLRAAHLIPLAALVAAGGAGALVDALRKLFSSRAPAFVRGALAVVLLTGAAGFGGEAFGRYRNYFVDYPAQSAPYFRYGLRQALTYARAHQDEYDAVWVTGINQPYIDVLFYSRWPPNDVHRHLQVRRNPPWFNQVDGIGKYRFREEPDTGPTQLALLYTVSYPNGGVAWEVRGGTTDDGERMLFVYRP